jgi:hypothetical protein
MGWGAALAGGAEGVMGGWDDNREKIKAEAEQAFKLKLEQSRIDMAKTARDQAATDLMNPQSPTGMLAQRQKDEALQNAEIEAVNADSLRQAEWAREDKNKRLDREGTLAAAKAKAGDTGKMPPKVKAAFDMATAIRGQEVISDQDAKLLAGYDKIVQDYVGMEPPKPSAQEMAWMAKNIGNPNAVRQFTERYGQAALDNVQPQKKGGEKQVKTTSGRKTGDDREGASGGLALGGAYTAPSDISAMNNKQMEAARVMIRINKSIKGGESVDNHISELSGIAKDTSLNSDIREEARRLLGGMKKPKGVY